MFNSPFTVIVLVVIGALLSLWVAWAHESVKYCRLQFGDDKGGAVVLVALTRDNLRLYRSGRVDSGAERYPLAEGRLSAETHIPPVTLPSGDQYSIVQFHRYNKELPSSIEAILVDVRVERDASSLSMYCDVDLSEDAATAETAEFVGPFAVRLIHDFSGTPTDFRLIASGLPTLIECAVGRFDKARGVWTVVDHDHEPFINGLRPTATVEYPTDGEETTKAYTVPKAEKKFCCGFRDIFVFPTDVLAGTAQVSFQMDGLAGMPLVSASMSVWGVNFESADMSEIGSRTERVVEVIPIRNESESAFDPR